MSNQGDKMLSMEKYIFWSWVVSNPKDNEMDKEVNKIVKNNENMTNLKTFIHHLRIFSHSTYSVWRMVDIILYH